MLMPTWHSGKVALNARMEAEGEMACL